MASFGAEPPDGKWLGHLRDSWRATLEDYFHWTRVESLIGEKPLTASEIAAHLRTHPQATKRFLNAWVSLGLLGRSEGKYQVTPEKSHYPRERALALLRLYEKLKKALPLDGTGEDTEIESEYLKLGNPERMLRYFRYYFDVLWPFFNSRVLHETMRTGESQWKIANGQDVRQIFELYATQPELLGFFSTLMEEANIDDNRAIANAIDLKGRRSVLDVAGGNGGFAQMLADANPGLEKIHVLEVESARNSIVRRATSPKITYRWGDILRASPHRGFVGLSADARYEVIVLGWILHDWIDEDSRLILDRARRHLAPGGKVIVLETILPEDGLGPLAVGDVQMLVFANARDRTLTQYREIFRAGGFDEGRVLVSHTRRQVIEITPRPSDCGPATVAAGVTSL